MPTRRDLREQVKPEAERKKSGSFLDSVKDFMGIAPAYAEGATPVKEPSLKEKVVAPPPAPAPEHAAPAAAESSVTETKTSTRGPVSNPAAGIDKRFEDLEKRMLKYYEDANNLPPEDKLHFQKKLDDAQKMLANKEGELERRELVEMMSHAVSQLGAGLYGMKTGTDLSGLKFSKQDWDKRLDRALNKYKLGLDTITEERNREDKKREFSARQAQAALSDYAAFQRWKEEQKARGVQHVDEMDYRREALDAKPKPADKTESEARRVQLGRLKDWEGFLEDLQSDKKVTDPALAMSQLQQKAARLGVNPQEITKIIEAESEWFEGTVDPDDVRQVASKVNALIDAQKDFVVVGGKEPAASPTYKPGTTIEYNGKKYLVGSDGESLTEVR